MAISKCPECNKDLSSTAKSCVHCGCEVKACPDCDTLSLASADTCSNCGYEFNQKAKEEKKKNPLELFDKAFNTWMDKSSFEQKRKLSTLFRLLAAFPLFALMFTPFLLLFEELDLLSGIKLFEESSAELLQISYIMLCVSFCILYFLSNLFKSVFQTSAQKSFYKHCKDENISIKEMLSQVCSVNYDSIYGETRKAYNRRISLALNAEYYTATNKTRTLGHVLYILQIAASTIWFPIGSWCMISFFPNLQDIASVPLNVSSVQNILAIVLEYFLPFTIVLGVEIVLMIALSIVTSNAKKAKLDWVSENIPEARSTLDIIQKKPEFIELNNF